MSKISRKFLGSVLTGGIIIFIMSPAFLKGQSNTVGDSRPSEIILAGKLYCSLKRSVIMFFPGEIASLAVAPGQKVAAGKVLATCRLSPEAVVNIQRRLSPPQIRDLEAKVLETRKNLAVAEEKLKGLSELAKEKLVSSQSITQAKRDKQALAKQLNSLEKGLAKERQMAEADLQLLEKQLGRSIKGGLVPKEVALVAPISGHIVWIHPELRQGTELKANEPVFQIGIMDPMIIRAKAHEIEAMQLAIGDRAEVTMEALPDRKFQAQVSRLPWSPATLVMEQPSYYDVEFTLANPEFTLREGLKAQIVLRKSGQENN